jgi:hypothetical protein
MSRRHLVVLCVAVLAACVPLQLALADKTVIDDRRGDGGRAKRDIDLATAGHKQGMLLHTVKMYGRFKTGTPRICVLIQTNESGFRICGRNVERTSDAQVVGQAKVTRPDRKTIGFKFPKSAIGRPSKYDWHAAVGAHTIYCNAPPCDITTSVVHRL